jgi:hypothetical protein
MGFLASSSMEATRSLPTRLSHHPFGIKAGCHHPRGQCGRVQADGGIDPPQLIAQEGHDVALDVEDEGEEPAEIIGSSELTLLPRPPGLPCTTFARSLRINNLLNTLAFGQNIFLIDDMPTRHRPVRSHFTVVHDSPADVSLRPCTPYRWLLEQLSPGPWAVWILLRWMGHMGGAP